MQNFYDLNAQEFIQNTLHADMSELYQIFLQYVPKNAHILDAGSGSGRDSLYFIQQGYQVTAIDASEVLGQMASRLIGQPVLHMRFQEMEFENEFDAIWACASLLHVSPQEIDEVMSHLSKSLKPQGVFFASFKYGTFVGERNGRFFHDYDENTFKELMKKHPSLKILKFWQTSDARPDRQDEFWLNVLMQKVQ